MHAGCGSQISFPACDMNTASAAENGGTISRTCVSYAVYGHFSRSIPGLRLRPPLLLKPPVRLSRLWWAWMILCVPLLRPRQRDKHILQRRLRRVHFLAVEAEFRGRAVRVHQRVHGL